MNSWLAVVISLVLSVLSSASSTELSADAQLELQAPALSSPLAKFTFDKDRPGSLPAKFHPGVLGAGRNSIWKIKEDSTAPSRPYVLAQVGQVDPGQNFAAALIDVPPLADADLTVQFKAVSGSSGQGAAVVYRYQDAQDYYLVWADTQNDEMTLWRMRHGKVRKIDEKQTIITANIWHKLRIIVVRNTYRLYIDDVVIMAGKDKAILDAGRLALATPQDGVSYFDNLIIAPGQLWTPGESSHKGL